MNPARRSRLALVTVLSALPWLGGCAVAMVGGAVVATAVSVTGTVVSTGVELTGKAVGAGIDAMAAPSQPKPPPAPAAGPATVASVPVRPASAAVLAAQTTGVTTSEPVVPTPLEPRLAP
jgi:hypothetical protein